MKPVIKKHLYYSMLLMRDDSAVRSFRIKCTFLRVCLMLFLLLLVSGAVGIGIGVHYWKRYLDISTHYAPFERELVELRLKVEQLTNESTLWRNSKNSAFTPKNEELGSQPNITEKSTPTTGTTSILAPLQNANATSVNGTLAREGGISSATNSSAPTSPVSLPSATVSDPSIKINNFNVKGFSPQRMRLRYTINSQDQQQVTGTTSYMVRQANGTSTDVTAHATENSRFSITRMKNVETYITLPPTVPFNDIEKIQLVIDIDTGQRIEEIFSVR